MTRLDLMSNRKTIVIPAKAGIQPFAAFAWIPAFAGMTPYYRFSGEPIYPGQQCAKAGIQVLAAFTWIPAFAGMTLTPDFRASQSIPDSSARKRKSSRFPPKTSLSLEVAIEVLVGTYGFEVNQTDRIVERVSQKKKLSLASELVNKQLSKVALLSLADGRIRSNGFKTAPSTSAATLS